jgi:hypothetical protein
MHEIALSFNWPLMKKLWEGNIAGEMLELQFVLWICQGKFDANSNLGLISPLVRRLALFRWRSEACPD